METFGIIVNNEKDEKLEYTKILVDSICSRGGKVLVSSEISKKLSLSKNYCESDCLSEDNVIDNSQIIICLGGDGTFLKAAREVYKRDVPILGINLGSLGFLTEVDKDDIDAAVGLLMQGKYEIEERMMLEAVITDKGREVARDIALNDVVISRIALSRILNLKTYINNVFVDSFPGDGLIISSPTGSTAYSLSAGGPIVEPDLNLMIVTPICPHILYSRSFITTGDRVVKVIVDENYTNNAMVTVDGQKGYILHRGYNIEIKKSSHSVKLLRINSRNYFNVLRTKIYDRGERLRKDEI